MNTFYLTFSNERTSRSNLHRHGHAAYYMTPTHPEVAHIRKISASCKIPRPALSKKVTFQASLFSFKAMRNTPGPTRPCRCWIPETSTPRPRPQKTPSSIQKVAQTRLVSARREWRSAKSLFGIKHDTPIMKNCFRFRQTLVT